MWAEKTKSHREHLSLMIPAGPFMFLYLSLQCTQNQVLSGALILQLLQKNYRGLNHYTRIAQRYLVYPSSKLKMR